MIANANMRIACESVSIIWPLLMARMDMAGSYNNASYGGAMFTTSTDQSSIHKCQYRYVHNTTQHNTTRILLLTHTTSIIAPCSNNFAFEGGALLADILGAVHITDTEFFNNTAMLTGGGASLRSRRVCHALHPRAMRPHELRVAANAATCSLQSGTVRSTATTPRPLPVVVSICKCVSIIRMMCKCTI
jgi:hypothetical protein